MPDLGAYAFEVSLAYAGSLIMMLALVTLSVMAAKRTKAQLDDAERRSNGG